MRQRAVGGVGAWIRYGYTSRSSENVGVATARPTAQRRPSSATGRASSAAQLPPAKLSYKAIHRLVRVDGKFLVPTARHWITVELGPALLRRELRAVQPLACRVGRAPRLQALLQADA